MLAVGVTDLAAGAPPLRISTQVVGATLNDVRRAATDAGLANRIDWSAAATVMTRQDGVAREISLAGADD